MKFTILLSISLLSALPVWSQVNSATSPDTSEAMDANTTHTDDARMLTPPPVSGEAYDTTPESEKRSNYLEAGVELYTTYSDNVLGGVTSNPVSDVSYSVMPTIELYQTTTRLKSRLNYTQGFTFYQHTTDRDETDQSLSMDVEYRVTEHVTASVRDGFQRTSSVFNQPDPAFSGAVYGSLQPETMAVLPPVADQLTNAANLGLSYQFSASGMVGVSGIFTNLHYPSQSEVPGLHDSSSRGGSAFYSHRISTKQYVGGQYQYSRILAFPTGAQFETQTQTLFLFYTVYVRPTLSFSLSGGPQHFQATEALSLPGSWSPAAAASLGWQGRRATFAAGYARTITGGGGLIGTFQSNNAALSARLRLDRAWSIGVTGDYAILKNVTPSLSNVTPGGHTISGTASLRHPIGQYFDVELGYTRVHQSYSEIAVVSSLPNINREYVAVSYHFTRPLGR